MLSRSALVLLESERKKSEDSPNESNRLSHDSPTFNLAVVKSDPVIRLKSVVIISDLSSTVNLFTGIVLALSRKNQFHSFYQE